MSKTRIFAAALCLIPLVYFFVTLQTASEESLLESKKEQQKLTDELNQLKQKLSTTKEELNSVQEEKTRVLGELEDGRLEIQRNGQRIKESQHSLELTESELKSKWNQLANFTTNVEELQKLEDTITQEIGKKSRTMGYLGDLSEVDASVSIKQEELKKVSEESERLTSSIASLRAELDAVERRLAERRTELQFTNQNITEGTVILEAIQEQLSAKQLELDSLKEQMNNEVASLQQTENQDSKSLSPHNVECRKVELEFLGKKDPYFERIHQRDLTSVSRCQDESY
jgi:chromosome segregation ATPase